MDRLLRRALVLPFFALAAAAMLLHTLPARGVETDCVIHDPSSIVKKDGRYWIFGTGPGCRAFSSKDRLHWKPEGQVFAAAPGWVAAAVPGNTRNSLWAPDVYDAKGTYRLYYSVSTFGRNVSAIGLATSTTLRPSSWVDQGIVVRSRSGDHFNAIDPCVVQDAHGGLWLTFGSFWGGIQMIPLDPRTGKPRDSNPTLYHLASHPQDPADSIEASCVYFHKGYYYLFVNWDYCCRGSRSTYNIRVGRSRTITGPYQDRENRDMADGGGTVFLPASLPSVGRIGNDADELGAEVGPGHAAILADKDGDWFSCHYEWARDHDGAPTLNLDKLVWDSDGWPRIVPGPEAGPKPSENHVE